MGAAALTAALLAQIPLVVYMVLMGQQGAAHLLDMGRQLLLSLLRARTQGSVVPL